MRTMKSTTTTQGVIRMKKSIFVGMLAVALVLAFAASAYAIGPFYSAVYENNGTNIDGKYLSWDYAETMPGQTGSSPHGGYTANTNKCAVCHSVHTAEVGGSVLTAGGPYATYAQGCVFCHGVGNTFTNVIMTANPDGYISPHGTCSRCHALNPHGVGTSEYPVMASALINKNGDAWIGADLSASANGLVNGMFYSGTPAELAAGRTLGTGYLCGNCHNQSFAVNNPGFDPASPGTFTGHRVTAMATGTWNAATYGASASTVNHVAFANANRCQACHDAKVAGGVLDAFPHGYVDAAGAVTPKTVAGSSYIWLTLAADANDAKTVLGKVVPETGLDNANLLTEDGLCLKCHRADTGSTFSGVGQTY